MNDTIYGIDAIQALIDTEEIKGFAYRMLEDRFIEIPSADRPQGEWIATTMVDCGAPIWLCSMCEYESYGTYNFCPHCGARMKGADDEV